VQGFEGLFHAAVFTGMKGEDGDATAGFQAGGEDAEEGIECDEFLVYGDADGLEDAADGFFNFLGIADQGGEGFPDGVCQREGFWEIFPGEAWGEEVGAGLVRIEVQGGFQFFGRDAGEPLGCGDAALRVHAHVERAGGFEAEAAGGIIELHGGAAEVCEDEIDLGDPGALQGFGEAGVVGADGLEGFGAVTEGAEAGFGFGELDGVEIEADEFSAGGDFL
jgi:hypothetical protein